MKLPKNVSGSLVVCVAAAAFAAGALFVEPDDPTSSAVAAPAPIDAAASGGYGGTDAAAGNATTTAIIEISDFEISAARVAPGATVTVINRDDTAHTVTARNRSFSSGNRARGIERDIRRTDDAADRTRCSARSIRR